MIAVKIEVHSDEVARLLKSNEVMSCLKKHSKTLGQMDSSYVGFDRAHVLIKKGAVQDDNRNSDS